MATEGIDELRAAVAWCNGQNENHWLPYGRKAPSAENILAAYRLTGGEHIESWLETATAGQRNTLKKLLVLK
jgi:hypothetical protein